MTDRGAGSALAVGAVVYLSQAVSYRAGFIADPIGPRAFPFGIGGLLFVLALVLVLRPGGSSSSPKRPFLLRGAALVASLFGYVLALDIVGFILATALIMTFVVVLFEGPLLRGLVASLSLTLVLFALFVYGFAVPLPTGYLFPPS